LRDVGSQTWESGKPDSTGQALALLRRMRAPPCRAGLAPLLLHDIGSRAWESGKPDSTGQAWLCCGG